MKKKNENEKLAQQISGIESEAKHFTMTDGKTAEEILKNEELDKNIDKVNEYVEKYETYLNDLSTEAEKINCNIENLQIKAILNYAIIKPYSTNPFQRIKKSESGLFTDLGGKKPEFKNRDNGRIEEEENYIHVGTVVDAGNECKYLKEGDTVMWTAPSEVPVPFFKLGLVLVNENRIMVVINDNLKERFN